MASSPQDVTVRVGMDAGQTALLGRDVEHDRLTRLLDDADGVEPQRDRHRGSRDREDRPPRLDCGGGPSPRAPGLPWGGSRVRGRSALRHRHRCVRRVPSDARSGSDRSTRADRQGALAVAFPALARHPRRRRIPGVGDRAIPGPPRHRGSDRAVGGSQARLVVLDDLHWADAASLELVAYLVRRPPHASVLLAFGARPGQGAPEAAKVVNALLAERTCDRAT